MIVTQAIASDRHPHAKKVTNINRKTELIWYVLTFPVSLKTKQKQTYHKLKVKTESKES